MNKYYSMLMIVLLVPLAVAWNQEECEDVDWDHIDCSWGGPTEPDKPLESVRSGSGRHTGSVSLWYIMMAEHRPTSICARSYEVRTFPGTNVFRVTGVERFSCLDTDIYLRYPSLLGVYKP